MSGIELWENGECDGYVTRPQFEYADPDLVGYPIAESKALEQSLRERDEVLHHTFGWTYAEWQQNRGRLGTLRQRAEHNHEQAVIDAKDAKATLEIRTAERDALRQQLSAANDAARRA